MPKTELTKVQQRNLSNLEGVIAKGMQSFVEVGNSLKQIKEGMLWIEHETFERYLKIRWGMGKSYGNYMIASSEAATKALKIFPSLQVEGSTTIVADLSTQINESQARELAKVKDENELADVLQKSIELAKKEGKPQLTAAVIKKARQEVQANGEVEYEDVEEDEEEIDDRPAWEIFAEIHKDALNHLTKISRLMNDLAKTEGTEYLMPVAQRIRQDIKQLRGTIYSNCPTGEREDGTFVLRVQQRK